MKLAIGNDHVAVEMKKEIKKYLEDKGIEVIDVGTNSTESFNYPISGYKVGKMVASGEVDGGVLICGTGVGISLAANIPSSFFNSLVSVFSSWFSVLSRLLVVLALSICCL